MSSDDRFPEYSPHDRLRLLLPWYVNHSLENHERERVRAHLQNCPSCRAETERLTAFAENLKRSPLPGLSPQASYLKLMNIVERRTPGARRGVRRPDRTGWIKRVFGESACIHPALAWALLLLLAAPAGWWLWTDLTEPRFHTLADSTQEAVSVEGDLRVVFEGAPSLEWIDALLRSAGVRRIAGPDPAGVYTACLLGEGENGAALATAIARLRNREGVVFVEPVRRP